MLQFTVLLWYLIPFQDGTTCNCVMRTSGRKFIRHCPVSQGYTGCNDTMCLPAKTTSGVKQGSDPSGGASPSAVCSTQSRLQENGQMVSCAMRLMQHKMGLDCY